MDRDIGQIKLNLGCGVHTPKNWINYDSSFRVWLDRIPYVFLLGYQPRFANWVRRFDVRKPLPFPDQSVQYIYSSHMIEHLSHFCAETLLKECHRVLRVGGRIRLMTPNLFYSVENYLSRRTDSVLRNSAADHFFRSLFVVEEEKHGLLTRCLHLFQNKNRHQWLYDDHSLKFFLERCGFRDVVAKDHWVSDFPDLDELEPKDLRLGSVCAEGFR